MSATASGSGSPSATRATTSTPSKPIPGAKRILRAPTPIGHLALVGNLKRWDSSKENLAIAANHPNKGQGLVAPAPASIEARKAMTARKLVWPSKSTCSISKPPVTSAPRKNALGASSSSGAALNKASSGSSVAPVFSGVGKRKPWDLQGRLKDLEQLVTTLSGDKHQLQLLTQEQTEQVQVLQKDKTELQVQLENVRMLTEEINTLKAELRLKTATVNELTADLARSEAESKSLQETVSRLTGSYAGLRAEHSAMQVLLEAEQKKSAQLALSLCQSESREAVKEQQLQEAEMLRRDLHNTLLELKGNIRVFCRVRPLLPSEKRAGDRQSRLSFPDDKTVQLVRPDSEEVMVFPFDRVFPGTATQGQVYKEVEHVVQSALDGYNVCIFAYGQTGSGKTFTMEGPPGLDLSSLDNAELGLIPRALQQVFSSAQELQRSHHWQFTMAATFLEIYNDKVCDLLSTLPRAKQASCQIKRDTDGSMMVTNATKTTVTSPEQIYQLLRQARRNRAVGATQCNEHSSRSHSVFRLHITGCNSLTGVGSRGLLTLVDLCGSERLDESKSEGVRLREAKHINRSLSNLGNVILALSNKAEHVPYRNSKLTFLLMDSLGGNSKTLMLFNISPREQSVGETINSLRFATMVNQCSIGAASQTVQASSQ